MNKSNNLNKKFNQVISLVRFGFINKVLNKLKIPVLNVWLINKEKKPTKRALFSFLVSPLRKNYTEVPINNFGECTEIIAALNRLGYLVDVIDYSSIFFIPKQNYDLCIYHGGKNIKAILSKLHQKTKIIYFSTGSYWRFHNSQEDERFDQLELRKGVRLHPYRRIEYEEDYALHHADSIIASGNSLLGETYKNFSNVHLINTPNFYPIKPVLFLETCIRKKNFLFFAGPGNVHKGLDLVLEAFSNLEQNIFICTKIDNDFFSIYGSLINSKENFHNVGWVKVNSDKFLEIIGKCAFVICPSCSEGQPSSVITCMFYGLIPIVSKECFFDLENSGFELEKNSIDEIEKTVKYVSKMSDKEIDDLKEKVIRVSEKYKPKVFSENFSAAIENIMKIS